MDTLLGSMVLSITLMNMYVQFIFFLLSKTESHSDKLQMDKQEDFQFFQLEFIEEFLLFYTAQLLLIHLFLMISRLGFFTNS